jgi:ADP-ribosyl-[dinitrogen reductase] hydrolase
VLTELVRDHFLGALYGVAVGDALGSPHEGQPGSVLRMKYGETPMHFVPDPRRGLRPGQWNDDTAQLIALVESYNACRDFEGLDAAARLVDWWKTNPRGPSELTRRVLRIFQHDLDFWTDAAIGVWYESAGTESGDGGLVRTLVAGMFHFGDIHKMVERTIDVCRLTHRDPRCIEASLVLNFVLVQLLHRRFAPNLAEQALTFLEATRRTRVWQANVLNVDRAILERHTNYSPYPTYFQAPNETLEALKRLPKARYEDLRATGRVADTMATALWCALHARTFEEAVHRAVMLGGKTDTQAALAGALAGARFGFARIPREWSAGVVDSARLMALGDVMIARAMVSEERDFQEGRREPQRRPPPVV